MRKNNYNLFENGGAFTFPVEAFNLFSLQVFVQILVDVLTFINRLWVFGRGGGMVTGLHSLLKLRSP